MSHFFPRDFTPLGPPPLPKRRLDRRLKAFTSHPLVATAFVIGALGSTPSPLLLRVHLLQLCDGRRGWSPVCLVGFCCCCGPRWLLCVVCWGWLRHGLRLAWVRVLLRLGGVSCPPWLLLREGLS